MAITVRQAIAWLRQCHDDAELRFACRGDLFEVGSIQEDLDGLAVYFSCNLPTNGDIQDRLPGHFEVTHHEVNTAEGCFSKVQDAKKR